MSVPPSRAQSELFSASQYSGEKLEKRQTKVNYFLIPVFVLELIGLACLLALFYYLRFTDVFPYHRRVFVCNDADLLLPNFLPRDFLIYVSEAVLFAVCILVPCTIILLGEIIFWLFSTRPKKTVYANCAECAVHLFTRRFLRFLSVFLFGALLVSIFIHTIKLMTGYQRPYFLTLCQPGIRQTFPSFYAGLSSFCMLFAACYIHYMVNLRSAPLLRPFLIAGLLAFTLIASFSRINGYKNHWLDIWVGWLIGAVAAFWLCHNVLRFREVYKKRTKELIIHEDLQENRQSPFFSWFRLPRINPPPPQPKEEDYSVYQPEEQRQRSRDRTYEVTTTTESFHRTIAPPAGSDNY